MEIHKCKLCTKIFVNGKALGGHMKSHLATLPLPTKKTTTTTTIPHHHHQLGTESASSSYSLSASEEEEDEEEVEEKGLAYGLRENPKKSFKFADPEFSSVVVVQDRESETESRNPTRRRSKRTRKSGFLDNHHKLINFDVKKLKFNNTTSVLSSPLSPSPPPAVEPEPVSSVSDTSAELEDVAMCLMMLSRDAWLIRNKNKEERDQADETKKQEIIVKVSKIRGKFRCEKCRKLFRSSQALVSHKKICSLNGTELRNINSHSNERIFECPYCFKVFGSGQALGGHKRSHLMGSSGNASSATTPPATAGSGVSKLIDLNLPAPMDDDDYSVVSDA
ncbi:zinc finger protein ZAT9-like [Mercurialis annua]|uniref:zinc finger protein ZAT9-like n=1 Tax=Mercurialis annua TaxID=3986 RepID=UPI002160692D|nr:zinc finger protein ZAT9-like [Mercurialis annua]